MKSKSKEEINKDIKMKFIALEEKRKIQLNYMIGVISSYRAFDDHAEEQLIKELKSTIRLNDQYYLLDEILTSK